MNNKLKMTWEEEEVMSSSEVLLGHLPEELRKCMKKSQSR
jgi:hypothetical protein